MAPAAAMQREAVRLAAVLVAVLRLRRLGLRRAAGDEGRQGVDGRRSCCGGRGLLVGALPAAARPAPRAADRAGCRAARRAAHSAECRAAARACRTAPRRTAGRRRRRSSKFSSGRGWNCWSLPPPSGRALEVRIVLAELLLRRRDQAEIVFGMLKVILGRDRIAGGLGVTRELEIFLRDVIGRSADLHVGPVGFVHPCQRVVTAAVVIVVVVVVLLLLRPRMRLL